MFYECRRQASEATGLKNSIKMYMYFYLGACVYGIPESEVLFQVILIQSKVMT